MKPAAIILAAGASRRMGTPKALLDWNGETFLDHLILLLGRSCDPVIAVLGHHAAAIRAGLRHGGRALLVENPDPDRGMLSSLQCGLAALSSDARAFLFTPVDQPATPPEAPAMLAALLEGGAPVAIPRCQGKRGHPVACSPALRAEFLAHPASGQARDIVARHLARAAYLDIADPGVIVDVDSPQDYLDLVAGSRAQ